MNRRPLLATLRAREVAAPTRVVEVVAEPKQALLLLRVEWAETGSEARSFLTAAMAVREMLRAMVGCARTVSVAKRISRAEAFVAMPARFVLFRSVSCLERHAQIRTNAVLLPIVNIRWAKQVWVGAAWAAWAWPMRGAWVERKRRQASVCRSRQRARRECLRPSPMIHLRASKLVNTNQ